jgi:hypothetical protein
METQTVITHGTASSKFALWVQGLVVLMSCIQITNIIQRCTHSKCSKMRETLREHSTRAALPGEHPSLPI